MVSVAVVPISAPRVYPGVLMGRLVFEESVGASALDQMM